MTSIPRKKLFCQENAVLVGVRVKVRLGLGCRFIFYLQNYFLSTKLFAAAILAAKYLIDTALYFCSISCF